jgi:Uma2 family endonuclease
VTVQDNFLMEAAEQVAAVLEGFKIEVVGGKVTLVPQGNIQSWTIRRIQNSVEDSGIAEEQLLSDVLIEFPGEASRCPDVAIVEEGADDPYSCEDLLAAIEVVSTKDDGHDYLIKLRQYARFGIPIYLIIDPFRAECVLFTGPAGDEYRERKIYAYGETITLALPDGSTASIPTDKFKRKN